MPLRKIDENMIDERFTKKVNDMATTISDADRQTSVLSQGVSVVSASANTPAKVEIEGRTLISLPNTPLETGKKYVLADKRTKVIVDGVTHSGVAKFNKTGEAGRATIIRVANFEGKVLGSVVENPHKFSVLSASVTTLQNPTGSWVEQADRVNMLDGISKVSSLNGAGVIAQHLFSFNLIEEVERNIGRIPRITVTDKVAWVKANAISISCKWHGFGSSVGGNKASLRAWNGAWSGTSTGSTSAPVLHTQNLHVSNVQNDGFVHFLAYAEPSNGTISSVINTDYIELEIEMSPNADFTNPKVPLYEVSDADYNKILVDWNADEVMRRYPAVEGMQHLQGVGVFAEGDNLLPPFTEWALHANTKVISPYELELNATASGQLSTIEIQVAAGQTYWSNFTGWVFRILFYDKNNIQTGSTVYTPSFVVPVTAVKANIAFYSNSSGAFSFKNPMLTIGAVAKPFVPRNPSYVIADVKLGAIGDKKDILYEQDGRWLLRESVRKDVVLDGSLAWTYITDGLGYKRVSPSPFTDMLTLDSGGVSSVKMDAVKYDKKPLTQETKGGQPTDREYFYGVHSSKLVVFGLSDLDTGFGETFTPTVSDIKRYFNGWKYSNGTTWTSVTGNGQTATAQVALDTKPNDYTPYKLSYVLATAQTIDVTDRVEGSLKVNGLTQVETLAGVIWREKVVPVLASSVYRISDNFYPSGNLKKRNQRILAVYKNGSSDKQWAIGAYEASYGLQRATLLQADYDPTAEYTVTYVALDKHLFTANPTNVKLTYAQNIRGAVDDINDGLQDNSTMLSVHEKAIVELYVRVKALEVR